MTRSGTAGYSRWQGEFDKDIHDIQIDVETSDAAKVVMGKLLMIGGRVMAVQGPIVEPGYEIDSMDAATLELQLAFKLLDIVLPNGPSSVQSPRTIDHTESKTGIQLATLSAEGGIRTPWHLVGKVKPADAGAIDYDLTLTSSDQNGSAEPPSQSVVTLAGTLSKSKDTRIDDQLNLENWKLFGVGVQTRKQQNSTYYDYSAAPTDTNYKTVSDVRKELAEQDYPGEADPSKNFTGFWKTDCDNAFGLRIMSDSPDGKYSVVFCGPGGCGDGTGRPTFITKDSQYQVVGEEELKVKSGEGWEAYHRCTKETHPVLRYKQP